MIVNVRGSNGAGKSFIGFKLLEEYGPGEELYSTEYFPHRKTGAKRKKPKLLGHVLPGGLVLIGRYRMKKSTIHDRAGYSGGMDGWLPVVECQRLIEDLCAQYPHALFESLMISGTFQRYLDLSVKLGGPEKFTFATLDTPLEEQLRRIQSRNGGREVDERGIGRHRAQVMRCAAKFHAAGARSLMIDHTQSYEQVVQLLKQGGWNPEEECRITPWPAFDLTAPEGNS